MPIVYNQMSDLPRLILELSKSSKISHLALPSPSYFNLLSIYPGNLTFRKSAPRHPPCLNREIRSGCSQRIRIELRCFLPPPSSVYPGQPLHVTLFAPLRYLNCLQHPISHTFRTC